jgi:hypothetical protein
MPLSIISAESSGGVSLKTCFIAWIISVKDSEIEELTSLEETLIFRGRPRIKSRPLISNERGSFSGKAVPIFILISSAV